MIAILLVGCGLFYNAEHKIPEDKDLSSGTSVMRSSMAKINNVSNVVNYEYNTQFAQKRNVRLKDVAFEFWEDVLFSNDIYLQGICFTEEYLLISSYSTQQNALGKIMVFEKETGEYLLSLGMDSNSHLGGIAYDGENVWVCNSSKLAIERISYEFICNEVEHNKGKFVDVRTLTEKYSVGIIPSCITYHNEQLWVATHAKYTNSQMISYEYDKQQDELSYVRMYHIPSRVQGVAFDENGRVILSTSYGRNNSSYLRIYRTVEGMSTNVDKYEVSIEMPPCSEGLAIEKQQIYLLFESAAEKYLEGTDGNGKCIAPLDKILIIDPT